jgi:hypothetical protein
MSTNLTLTTPAQPITAPAQPDAMPAQSATLTLAQFTATRTACSDLGAATENDDLSGQSGWLYVGCLYIQNLCTGAAWTILDRDEYTGTLPQLEPLLYAWACREGYCDSATP